MSNTRKSLFRRVLDKIKRKSRLLDDENELQRAILSDNVERCREILRGKVWHTETDGRRQQLISCARNGKADIFDVLVDAGADVESSDNYGYSALHKAAWNGHMQIVERLISEGAKLDERTGCQNTALSLACHGNYLKIAEILISRGCDVKISDKDLDTSFHYAALNGNTEMAKLLLKHGANPDARNARNVTPLWNAVLQGHADMVRFLIKKYVDLNVESQGSKPHFRVTIPIYRKPKSALCLAASLGRSDIARLLVLAGCDYSTDLKLHSDDFYVPPNDESCCESPLVDFLSNPFSLMLITRRFVRNHFGMQTPRLVTDSNVPRILQNYILLEYE